MKRFSFLSILLLVFCSGEVNAQSGVDDPRLIEKSYEEQIKRLEQKIRECEKAKQNAEFEKNRKIQEGYSQEKIDEENKGIQMYAESIETYYRQIAILKEQKQTVLQQTAQIERALKKAVQREQMKKKETEMKKQQDVLNRRKIELAEKARREAEARARAESEMRKRAEERAKITAAKQQRAEEIEMQKRRELQNSYGNNMHAQIENNVTTVSQLDEAVSSAKHRNKFLQGDLSIAKDSIPSKKKSENITSINNLLDKVKQSTTVQVDSMAIWLKELEQVNKELGELNKKYDELLLLKAEEDESNNN